MRTLAFAVALGALAAVAAAADAADVPIAGSRLALSASLNNLTPRNIAFRTLDAAIAGPFADPADGASLRVFASNAPGQCHANIALPAANWRAIGGDGPNRGWKYSDKSGAASGIRSVIIRPGKIVVRGRGGAAFPCGLEAAQQTPIAVVVQLGTARFCASFGGAVLANRPGQFRAIGATEPAACPDTADLTVATLNILHGISCPGGDRCRQEERVILAGQFIVERGCPDVVAFQEVLNANQPSIVTNVQNHLLDICPFPYQVLYTLGNNVDDSLLLTRYPVIASQLRPLKNNFRNVLFARIDHPAGAFDVFSTHLASGSDGGSGPCGTDCPPACLAAGAVTLRDCQAVQTAEMVEELHDGAEPAVVVGDFNAQPGSFVYQQFVDRGWSDAYLAAGNNPECDPMTGFGCTSGREDSALTDLESPALNVGARIDFAFLVPPGPNANCAGTLDDGSDNDGDGTATRHFADVPNPFAPTCGAAPDPICWSSDHNGVQADINCN